MTKDIMTAEERLEATIALKPVDRVVCAPWVVSYAWQFSGKTNKEFMWNWDTAMSCFDKLAENYPAWDCYADTHNAFGDATLMRDAGFNKYKFPGVELADNAMYQTIEEEVVSRDDLRLIITEGFGAFFMKLMTKIQQAPVPTIIENLNKQQAYHEKEVLAARKRGQSVLHGCTAGTGNELFSFVRSMDKYIKDMFQMGDELIEILYKANEESLPNILRQAAGTGVRRAFFPGTRTSGAFLSKKNFECFSWPIIKDLADKLITNDIIPIFHLDTNWGRDLENFLQLPKGKFVIHLDGETDIFKAKEVLGGHACLGGDIPAALFALGSPAEVDEYCKNLITIVGKDGGFMLRPGCTLPMNSKHENVKAMFDAVEKYGRYN